MIEDVSYQHWSIEYNVVEYRTLKVTLSKVNALYDLDNAFKNVPICVICVVFLLNKFVSVVDERNDY